MEVLPTRDSLWALTLVHTGVLLSLAHKNKDWSGVKPLCDLIIKQKVKGKKLVQEQWDCVGEFDSKGTGVTERVCRYTTTETEN